MKKSSGLQWFRIVSPVTGFRSSSIDILGWGTLVTLLHIVTPYRDGVDGTRDSVEGTRDSVTSQKLVTR